MIAREANAGTPTRNGRKRRGMYYYAHLNEDRICDAVYEFPSIIHDPDYVRVSSAGKHIVGRFWNADLAEFQRVYYYACLNDKGLVEETIAEKQDAANRIRKITFEQYKTVKGLWWDGTDYVEPPIHIKTVASTDEISYEGQDAWLTTVLDEMQEQTAENRARIGTLEDAIGNNAAEIASARVMIQLADDRMDGIASVVDGHASGLAEMEQTIRDMDNGIKALDTAAIKAQSDIASVRSTVSTVKSGLASANSHITSVANRATKLENRATSLESRMNGYLPLTGGTVSDDLNVDGVICVHGRQAYYFNVDTKSVNIGTNKAKTVNLAGHSGGTTNVNTAMFRPYSVVPRNSDSLLGNANFRWKGIYSQSSVNVASDERLKESIEPLQAEDMEALASFTNALKVVNYRYLGDTIDRIGLIAQDVIKADEKWSRYFVTSDADGYYSLKPADLVFPLIAAVQQLQAEVKQLRTKAKK